MKNLRMSTKLLISFMALCLLILLLGSATYRIVRQSANETALNLETRFPAILRANDATKQSLIMVAQMRSFSAKGHTADYESAVSMLALARDNFLGATNEASKVNSESTSAFNKVIGLLESYEKGIHETSAALALVDLERVHMSTTMIGFENDLAELRSADLQNSNTASIRNLEWWRAFARAQRLTREKLSTGQIKSDVGLIAQAVQETEEAMSLLRAAGGEVSAAKNDYVAGIKRIHEASAKLLEVEKSRKKLGDEIIAENMAISRREHSALKESGDAIAKRLTSATQFLVIGLIVCVLCSVFISVIMARTISRPLEEAARHATAISEGNYSQRLQFERKDEIGDLGRALNSVSSSLELSVTSMLEGVNVLSSSVSEIITSTSELAASASETAASVSETSATVEEVKQTGVLSNEKSQFVAQSARASTLSLREGEQAAELLTTSMDHILDQTASVAAAIGRLSEHSRLIGEIITSVDEIAEQSNILAVNAAIEAAKAGEQGRGFAVVAREIRNLSEQSKRSTGRVRGILAQIESGTAEAVKAVDRGNDAVEQGRNHTRLASKSIQDMRDVIKSTSEASAQIAVMSQQQVIGMDQATLAMSSIKQASHQTAESMRQLESAAQSLRDLGERLRDIASR